MSEARPRAKSGHSQTFVGSQTNVKVGGRPTTLHYPAQVAERVKEASSKSEEERQLTAQPDVDLRLEYAYGFNGRSHRNLHAIRPTTCVYNVGSLGVVFDFVNNKQSFFMEHSQEVTAVAFSKKSGLVATGQRSGNSGPPYISLWHVDEANADGIYPEKRRLIAEEGVGQLKVQCSIHSLAFSADGKSLFSVTAEACLLGHLESHNKKEQSKGSPICIWLVSEVGTGLDKKEIHKPHLELDHVQGSSLKVVPHPLDASKIFAFSNRVATRVTASKKDGYFWASKDTVEISQVDAVENLKESFSGFHCAAFVPDDNDTVALGGTGVVFVIEGKHCVRTLSIVPGMVVRFLDVLDKGPVICGGEDGGISFVSPDLKTRVKRERVVDHSGRPLMMTTAEHFALQDGSTALLVGTANGRIARIEFDQEYRLKEPFIAQQSPSGESHVAALCASPKNPNHVAVVDEVGQIRFFDAKRCQLLQIRPYQCQSPATCLAWGANGSLLVAGMVNGHIEGLTCPAWKQMCSETGDRQPLKCEMLFRLEESTGKEVTEEAKSSGSLKRSGSGSPQASSSRPLKQSTSAGNMEKNPAAVAALRFSPGETQFLACGFAIQGLIHLYRVHQPTNQSSTYHIEKVMRLSGNATAILFLQFSNDGSRLSSNAKDGQVLCWEVPSGKRTTPSFEEKDWFDKTRSFTLLMSWPMIGIWDSSYSSTTQIVAQANPRSHVTAVGDEVGRVKLHKFPAPLENAQGKVYHGHCSKVNSLVWTKNDRVISAGVEHGDGLLQWRLSTAPKIEDSNIRFPQSPTKDSEPIKSLVSTVDSTPQTEDPGDSLRNCSDDALLAELHKRGYQVKGDEPDTISTNQSARLEESRRTMIFDMELDVNTETEARNQGTSPCKLVTCETQTDLDIRVTPLEAFKQTTQVKITSDFKQFCESLVHQGISIDQINKAQQAVNQATQPATENSNDVGLPQASALLSSFQPTRNNEELLQREDQARSTGTSPCKLVSCEAQTDRIVISGLPRDLMNLQSWHDNKRIIEVALQGLKKEYVSRYDVTTVKNSFKQTNEARGNVANNEARVNVASNEAQTDPMEVLGLPWDYWFLESWETIIPKETQDEILKWVHHSLLDKGKSNSKPANGRSIPSRPPHVWDEDKEEVKNASRLSPLDGDHDRVRHSQEKEKKSLASTSTIASSGGSNLNDTTSSIDESLQSKSANGSSIHSRPPHARDEDKEEASKAVADYRAAVAAGPDEAEANYEVFKSALAPEIQKDGMLLKLLTAEFGFKSGAEGKVKWPTNAAGMTSEKDESLDDFLARLQGRLSERVDADQGDAASLTAINNESVEAADQGQVAFSALQRLSVALWPSTQQGEEASARDREEDVSGCSTQPSAVEQFGGSVNISRGKGPEAPIDIAPELLEHQSEASVSTEMAVEIKPEEVSQNEALDAHRMSFSEQWTSAWNGVLYGNASDAAPDSANVFDAADIASTNSVQAAVEGSRASFSEVAQAWMASNNALWQSTTTSSTGEVVPAAPETDEVESISSTSAGPLASSRVSAAPTTAGSEDGQDSPTADDQSRTSVWSNAWITAWTPAVTAQTDLAANANSQETSTALMSNSLMTAYRQYVEGHADGTDVDAECRTPEDHKGHNASPDVVETKAAPVWKRKPSTKPRSSVQLRRSSSAAGIPVTPSNNQTKIARPSDESYNTAPKEN